MSKKVQILSVDWDYFFPDIGKYDWGHTENPFFKNEIWFLRCASRNIHTGEYAINEANPRAEEVGAFWENVLKTPAEAIYIGDSHAEIIGFIEKITANTEAGAAIQVTNYDQHHDLYYSETPPGQNTEAECDNWASHLLTRHPASQYQIVYPRWRENTPEDRPNIPGASIEVHTAPLAPAAYDAIFVCRSSAWCPPWADEEFITFISRLIAKTGEEATTEINEYAITPRHPTKEEALELREHFKREVRWG